MGFIDVTIDRGGGGNSYNTGDVFAIKVGKLKDRYTVSTTYVLSSSVTDGGLSIYGFGITKCRDGFVIRASSAFPPSGTRNTVHIYIDGNFNYDEIEIVTFAGFARRVEVRNENYVLITDNGLPLGDGTYPPDAKNRAGLAGLHAVPAVIKPELDTVLMGNETNKERVQE